MKHSDVIVDFVFARIAQFGNELAVVHDPTFGEIFVGLQIVRLGIDSGAHPERNETFRSIIFMSIIGAFWYI